MRTTASVSRTHARDGVSRDHHTMCFRQFTPRRKALKSEGAARRRARSRSRGTCCGARPSSRPPSPSISPSSTSSLHAPSPCGLAFARLATPTPSPPPRAPRLSRGGPDPASRPSQQGDSRSPSRHHHTVTTRPREAPNLKFLRIAPKPPSDPPSLWRCWPLRYA